LLREGCCSSSTETSDFESNSEEAVLIHNSCSCNNPLYCTCSATSDSSDSDSEPRKEEKLKVCMFQNTGDQEAQMISQIKGLPEGNMKKSLLEAFIKTIKTKQKEKGYELPKRQPLFLDASFEKNTKTYIKFNREPKLQNISVTDLANELTSLRKEVYEIKESITRIQGEIELSYPVDAWAKQEIKLIKDKLESFPPPLEDAPFENLIQEQTSEEMQGIPGMQVLPIKYQKYYIKIQLEIYQEIFSLTSLIDTGSDINLLDKNKIPAKYWAPSFGSAIGLGNKDTDFQYEVSKGILLLEDYGLGMRFHISDLPVDCILGSPFLSAVEPHGSCLCSKDQSGYFITMPKFKDNPAKRIEFPFISDRHMQIAYYRKCMVIVEAFDHERNAPVTEYYDDNTSWPVFKEHWRPSWLLRSMEKIEVGLLGFSTNTNITVLPPQHILGQMHQPLTISSRTKLIEMGDLNRLSTVETHWYDHSTRIWMTDIANQSFQINRMRVIADWPNQDPNELLFGISYQQYKTM
jgi:hypothetical protein